MKITGGRSGLVMQQQLLAQRTNKANTSNNKAKNTGNGADNDGDNDGGRETARAQNREQAGGINYKQLTAAVNAGVVKPPRAPKNREENSGSGDTHSRDVSARQPDQSAKTADPSNSANASTAKQTASSYTAPPSRSANGAYNSSAQTETPQSSFAKGDIVNLSA